MPTEPGFYGVRYTYGYATDRLNDRNSNNITSVTINPGPGPGLRLAVEGDVTLFAPAPSFIWVSDWKILGAKGGAYMIPSFGNSSIDVPLTAIEDSGRSIAESQCGLGDSHAVLTDWKSAR